MSKALSSPKIYFVLSTLSILLLSAMASFAAVPPNDSCGGAIPIVISNVGFGLGLFTGTNTDLTSATLQSGETFAPSIIVAGLNKKSVWYKFTLPTTRAARISLAQPGSGIQAGNVGFAVYKSNACVPGNAEISTKFSPIEIFGSSFHPCVESGDYLVQVTSNLNANGPVFITVDLAEPSPALYDKPADAYQFANINTNEHTIHDFLVQCQSIDNAAENCLPNGSLKDFSKSTWHTFTTPAYFDYFNVMLADVSNSGNSILPKYTVGYRLYEGNSRTTSVASLIMQGGCDSLRTNGFYYDYKMYRCGDLKPNTTYTVQLLYHKDHNKTMRLALAWNGLTPTIAPQPIATIPTPNKIGILPSNSTNGITTTLNDNFGCNSRHSLYSCPKSMPVNGVVVNGYGYKLSTFYSFKLNASTSATFYAVGGCGSYLMRLYKQSLTNDCNDLDTVNMIGSFLNTQNFSCLDSGEYVLQIMGRDTLQKVDNYYYGNFGTGTGGICFSTSDLGRYISLQITAKTEVATNKFSLSATGKFDKINANGAGVMQPLQRGITYTAQPDTLGCRNTVLPDDDLCQPGTSNIYTKASYREFVVADSVILYVPDYISSASASKIFKGDLNALANSQGAFNYPQKITGVQPVSGCFSGYSSNTQNACITPGTYTIANFDNRLGYAVTTKFTILKPTSKFNTLAKAQDMGDIWQAIDPTYNVVVSAIDTFTCYDNPLIIDGVSPCNSIWSVAMTKQIYRQFYLSKPAIVSIFNNFNSVSYTGTNTLFFGKATDGVAQLKKIGPKWTCFTDVSSSQCEALPAGWYTVVSYGVGPNYLNPLPGNQYNIQYSDAGRQNAFYIRLTVACPQPKFNRPHKASIDTLTGQPYKLEWGPQTGHTPAYPVTGKRYTLNVENFDCSQDTTFINKNMQSCFPGLVKVAFYVFQITQESYVQIGALPYDFVVSMYNFDVRGNDSTRLKTDTALQPCLTNGKVSEFCKLQPGIYTLVYYGSSAYSASCMTITPTVYVDKLGTSRFDHANNAYDFGAIIPDSTWRNCKPGDVNPLDATRAPSNDFFYCTTGAQIADPSEAACMSKYNPEIYKAGSNVVLHPNNITAPEANIIDRRNLWYTFTVNHAGTIRLRIKNKTPNKLHQYPFAVYKSDVSGSLSFTQVVNNGLVDSTLAQGLSFIANNLQNYYCSASEEISFYIPPCSFIPTRYYIMVENRNPYAYADVHAMNPNSQVEVSVLFDSVSARPPKFDHYSQANDMGLVNGGIKKGETDNFTCATKDLPDPLHAYTTCQKTLWYKFTTTVTGQIRYAAFFKNTNNWYYDHIQLFRQIKPNDSSSTGLQHMPYTTSYTNNGNWAQQCISPGTYYIILPGCNAVNEDVYPQIEIIPQAGDFCSNPMVTTLTGPGSRIAPVTVDCHTIGTDYGEFNPTLTCPANAVTSNYKTSWYRLDITGADTLDVTVYIDEKTNAGSTDIKYRMMTGTCGAMQEQSCVQDALTRNTYKCLSPGNSYYIQVFSPTLINSYTTVTGDIDLNIAAVVHADTCLPASTCIGVANFTPQFDCTKDKDVIFTNFSTFGSSIQYDWDFGYNNQKSNAVSPRFNYPALTTARTYTVKMVLTNTICNKKDSVIQTITIPARPAVNLGRDTIICANGSTLNLDATSHTGSTYYWYNGSTQPTIFLSGINNNAWVEVTYGVCKTRDTINVLVNPVAKRALQTKALCAVTQVTLDANRGQGELYKWSNGTFASSIIVSQPGIYWVDMYWKGCIVRDSFQVVSSSLRPLGNDTTLCQARMPYIADATVSGANSYKWQNSSTSGTFSITKAGLYWVEINLGGCIFRDTLIVAVDSFKTANTAVRICQGQTYLLPSGRLINTAGIYKDSLKNIRGCDSILTTVILAVDTVKRVYTNVSICAGQTYTLSGGSIVSATGSYIDSVKNSNGCDSLITTINLSIAAVNRINKSAVICIGKSYILPSGKLVLTTGIYIDTLKAAAGCDSLITTVNLNVLVPVINTTIASICSGETYTLPSGIIVNVSGEFKDTLRYINGCDSLVRIVTVTVNPNPTLGADKSVFICAGSPADLSIQYLTTGFTTNWTLNGTPIPKPNQVFAAGVCQLIATNIFGCSDTATVTVSIDPKPNLGTDQSVAICSGNSLDLTTRYSTNGLAINWDNGGVAVTTPSAIFTAGSYQLIASNATGCQDTALVTVGVDPKPALGQDIMMMICPGSLGNLTKAFITTSLSINWTTGGLNVSNPAAVNAGIYQLIASNSSGCLDTALVTVSFNAKPDLGNDKTINICPGYPANLTTQYNTSGFTTNWTLNGTAVNNPTSIVTAGLYQLIVTNISGCTDTAFVTMAIDPKPALGSDRSLTICSGNEVDLTAQFITTGMINNWFIADLPVATPATIVAPGAYQLIVTNSAGCMDSAFVNLTVNLKPALGADKAVSACLGISIDLTKLYGTTGINAAWTFGGTSVTNPASISVAGIYQLIVTNNFTCSDTAVAIVTINQNPAVLITEPNAVCAPATVDLTSGAITTGSGTGLSYTYWMDAAASFVHVSPATTPQGLYYIKGEDANGCFNIKPVTVIVYSLPVAIAGRDTTICNQSFALLRGNATNLSGGRVSYLWSPPTGLAKADTLVTVARPGATATYTLTARVDYGPCTLSATDNIKINMQPPVAAFAGNDTIAVAGVAHQLRATGGVNYLWLPTGPLNNPSSPSPLAILQQDTRFTVRVTDFAGCVGTDTMLIKIYEGTTYYLPNAFSPNADGVNDIFRPIPAGIVSTDWFRIYSRYGQLVFETAQWMQGWDGNFRGIKQPVGNYIWAIKGKGRNGKVIELRGNVVLVR